MSASGTGEDALAAAVARGVEIFDLGEKLYAGMPISGMHPKFIMTLQRRHGDLVRPDGSSGANEVIVLGGHVGTHIDAFAHISFEGRLFGGVDANASQVGGRFRQHGVDTIAPMICRGILLDIPAVLGIERCPPAYEVTQADLEAAMRLANTRPRPGDVLLVRTGWGSLYDDAAAYENPETGAPGPGLAGATWLADFRPRAVGADTVAFERIAPITSVVPTLPVHKLMLVERGIHIIELLALEELAKAEVRIFTFFLSPLKLVGATGSPVRPLALRSLE